MVLIIEIDCPPGKVRPGDLFKNIMNDLSQNKNNKIKVFVEKNLNKQPNTKLFGEWKWCLEVESEIYSEIQNFFKQKLTIYYNQNLIRYASW